MNDSTCPRPCLMKLDLQSSTNKLAFLRDNWPSFGQIESIDRLSETELRCTLCLLDVVLAALAKDECFCPNREIIRLVLTRTYVQNRCELCETEEIRSKLVKGFCTREKKNGLSRKNNIRRRGISVFYGAILRMLSLFSSFRKEENRDTTDFLVGLSCVTADLFVSFHLIFEFFWAFYLLIISICWRTDSSWIASKISFIKSALIPHCSPCAPRFSRISL